MLCGLYSEGMGRYIVRGVSGLCRDRRAHGEVT